LNYDFGSWKKLLDLFALGRGERYSMIVRYLAFADDAYFHNLFSEAKIQFNSLINSIK
jgi:hypothetical protein